MAKPYRSTLGSNLTCGTTPNGSPTATFNAAGDHAQTTVDIREDRSGTTTIELHNHGEIGPVVVNMDSVATQSPTGVVSRRLENGKIAIGDEIGLDMVAGANKMKDACNSASPKGKKFHPLPAPRPMTP
jgi:hypothetical protein